MPNRQKPYIMFTWSFNLGCLTGANPHLLFTSTSSSQIRHYHAPSIVSPIFESYSPQYTHNGIADWWMHMECGVSVICTYTCVRYCTFLFRIANVRRCLDLDIHIDGIGDQWVHTICGVRVICTPGASVIAYFHFVSLMFAGI